MTDKERLEKIVLLMADLLENLNNSNFKLSLEDIEYVRDIADRSIDD